MIVYIHIWPQAWMKLSDTGVHDTQYTTQIDISLYVKEWSRILVVDSDAMTHAFSRSRLLIPSTPTGEDATVKYVLK